MTDLAYLSVAEGAQLLRSRKLSPVEWTKALLDRIAAVDPAIQRVSARRRRQALAQAKTAEAEIAAGQWRGPMHGVPYAAKDIFDIAGMATTCHSKIRIDHRAATDAFVIRKLHDAGAVLLGKLALHEFATGGPAFDLPWPPARNPWNRDTSRRLVERLGRRARRRPGAGRARHRHRRLGAQSRDLLRHHRHQADLRRGQPRGVFPLTYSLDHVGPMTRTVEDNAILLHAIAGHDPDDPTMPTRPLGDCLKDMKTGIKGLRIGVIEHFYTKDAPADPDQVRGIEQAIEMLRKLGAEVRTVQVSPLPLWTDCNRTIHAAEAYAIHERDIQERPEDFADADPQPHPGRRVRLGGEIHQGAAVARRAVPRVRRGDARSRRGDHAVEPAAALPDRRYGGGAQDLRPAGRLVFNVTGTPAISVPTGFSQSGMPLAMQIAGHAFDEPMVYRIAQAYCEAADCTLMPAHQPRVPEAARQPPN